MLATLGVILGAAYMLWLTKRVIFGKVINSEIKDLKDTNILENIMLIILAFFIIFFGFYPAPIMETINLSVDNLIIDYEQSLNKLSSLK